MQREEEIRLIAYQIWEEEGRPQGRDVEHWLKAEAIWREHHGHEPSGGPSEPPAQRAGGKRKRTRAGPRRSGVGKNKRKRRSLLNPRQESGTHKT
ncbi:MAG: DUF2934 domain-containing protein [Deltaproteobacteria bacterium]|nr:DUF2934 domain-containing protein [Deltaproteobacteria bacterium]